MQARRPHPLAPVAIGFQPQPMQSCRSSLLSASSSPRTPCGSPRWSPIHLSSVANRNSTDSWNSSNGPDEMEWDWNPEQISLLTRTLDALPAHLVTPFIGPVPPSNLLDKIARGVAHAKGPVDWPHSIRATRVKLLELAKIRAKEESLHSHATNYYSFERENMFNTNIPNVCTSPDKKQTIRRPLYRQNSMDFMNVAEPHLDEDNITGLSNRLQRTDKPSIYDSYTRKSRLQLSSTPPSKSFINPYTPSSSTLTSLASRSTLSQSRRLRRSTSSASTTSSMSITSGSSAPLSDPRLERLRSIAADIPPVPPPKDPKLGSKRAPSYGALVQGAKHEKESNRPATHERRNSTTSCASSDEEEKFRAERAKKQKMKVNKTLLPPLPPDGTVPLSPPLVPTKPSAPALRESFAKNAGSTVSKRGNARAGSNVKPVDQSELSQTITSPPAPYRKLPMNLQRNPSIFGDELPPVMPKSSMQMTTQSATPTTPAFHPNSPVPATSSLSSAHPSPSPGERCRQTLRRVRRLAPGRRISFGGLLPLTGNEDSGDRAIDLDAESNSKKNSLGSAFQMH